MKISIAFSVVLLLGIYSLVSCNKKKFLEEKPSSELFVPTTLEDFQLLLDNDVVMSETPVLGELSADNYYLTYTFWQTLNTKEHNAHIWEPDIYEGLGNIADWNLPYKQVFYANVILDGLNKIAVTSKNTIQWNTIKGSALFIRAYAFYNLAQVFAPVYDHASAKSDLGIPLRLDPDINQPTKRSTVHETYTQILTDLQEASRLLPDSVPVNRNRPSKPAAFALLARVYISMRVYEKAGAYADSSLRLYNKLIDYNMVDVNTLRPFSRSNDETMYQSKFSETNVLKGVTIRDCIVDSNLYRLYNTNDLRRAIFYTINTSGFPNTKGSYNGTILSFSGFATDEMYLVRAECRARLGNKSDALSDVNTLLEKRFKMGTFVPYNADTTPEAETLNIILTERRKELPFRGVRWTDIRRLNKEGAGLKLTRKLNGQVYELLPNSPLFVLPIPADVIQLSGIEQNNRN